MKTIVGKVVQVGIDVSIKGLNKTYQGWQLVYQTPDNKVETLAKHISTLTYQPSLKASLESLKPGDDFTVELEKKDKFWEVMSISKGTSIPTSTAPQPRQYKTDRTERSDEVQRMIVRQSSLAQAVATVDDDTHPDDILALAEKYETWVMRKADSPEVE